MLGERPKLLIVSAEAGKAVALRERVEPIFDVKATTPEGLSAAMETGRFDFLLLGTQRFIDICRGLGQGRARELLDGYRADIERLLPELTSANHALAVRIASLPDKVRGYGHVRQASATAVSTERDQLLAQWRQPQAQAETAWATELAR